MDNHTHEKPQHTPTPWTLDEAGIIWGPHEEWGGVPKGYPSVTQGEDMSDDDKAYIVLAVNAHEELLWTLKRVAESGPLNNGLRDDNTMALVREAIAKAEGNV